MARQRHGKLVEAERNALEHEAELARAIRAAQDVIDNDYLYKQLGQPAEALGEFVEKATAQLEELRAAKNSITEMRDWHGRIIAQRDQIKASATRAVTEIVKRRLYALVPHAAHIEVSMDERGDVFLYRHDAQLESALKFMGIEIPDNRELTPEMLEKLEAYTSSDKSIREEAFNRCWARQDREDRRDHDDKFDTGPETVVKTLSAAPVVSVSNPDAVRKTRQ